MSQHSTDENTPILTWGVQRREIVLDRMYVVYEDNNEEWFNGPTHYTLYENTNRDGVKYHNILVEDSESEPMDVMGCFYIDKELVDAHWYLMKTEFLITGSVSRDLALSNSLLQGTSGG